MKNLLENVRAVLSTTPERWQRLVDTLEPDVLSRPATEGEWSAVNCLQHLLDVERVLWPARIRAFLLGLDFEPYDPGKAIAEPEVQTPAQLMTAFVHYRKANLDLLSQLKDDDLERTAQHPTFGTVTLSEMLHTWAAHDLNHTVQAERALMQPFLLGCGPWRAFYQDHYIAAHSE